MIRIGIVDSGIDGAARARVAASADFPAGEVAHPSADDGQTPRDRHGHGSQVAAIIARVAGPELLDARVFFETLITSAAQAAAALDWMTARRARLVNLSFGLREDREVLRAACTRALDAGIVLVAAAPARGGPVYPAAYPGVLRATGDARCAPGEIAWLHSAQADFGGHVRWPDGRLAGASAGAAALSAALAALLEEQPQRDHDALLEALRRRATYHGPEQRGQPPR